MCSRRFSAVVVLALVCSLWVASASLAQVQGDDPELQKFQGAWVMVSAEMDGKQVEESHVKQSKITFIGDKVELVAPHQHNDVILATITKLDTTKTPAEMHWVRSSGPNAGATMIAIYEFESPDQYKICFDPAAQSTPEKFGTEAGSGHIWHIWKHVQP